MNPVSIAELGAIGVAASVFGSLVGLGGGFIVVPVLRLMGIAPAVVAGTSLVFVFANVAASAVGYLRLRRVDLGIAAPLAMGAIPGSIAGALAVKRISATGFDIGYGAILIVMAILVLRRRNAESVPAGQKTFAHRYAVAIPAGFLLGVLSSLFGIGGGIVVIPLMLIGARIAPHVVTATSAFVIAITAPVGVVVHTLARDIDWAAAVPLIGGGLAGGALAPLISKRVSSPRLVTLLGLGLIGAAIGLVARHLR